LHLYKSFGLTSFKALSICLLWVFTVYKIEVIIKLLAFITIHPRKALLIVQTYLKKVFVRIKCSYIIYSLLVLSLTLFSVQIYQVERKFQILDFAKAQLNDIKPDKDFLAKNYYMPAEKEITFSKKNNLIVVLAESLETSFFDSATSTSPLNSNLMSLRKDAAYFSNMEMLSLSSWTIAATTCWHFGLPLKLPSFLDGNSYHSQRGFLPGAKSIFEILKQNGYKTVLVMGSDSKYSGMKTLFETHGGFTIFDRSYFESKGWSLNTNKGTGWGYSDKFVLNRAKEIYSQLKKEKQPFVLFVQTIDTHSPSGYAPRDSIKYGDIRDAFVEVDKNLSDFISYIQTNDSSKSALAVLGDHLFMGNPSFLAPRNKRKIFNLFWTKDINFNSINKAKRISALDIAPTLLQLSGAKWSTEQFGLGISAFSSESTLIEKYGLTQLNQELAKKSPFYLKFY
jgi:phosphoglycerol transferase